MKKKRRRNNSSITLGKKMAKYSSHGSLRYEFNCLLAILPNQNCRRKKDKRDWTTPRNDLTKGFAAKMSQKKSTSAPRRL